MEAYTIDDRVASEDALDKLKAKASMPGYTDRHDDGGMLTHLPVLLEGTRRTRADPRFSVEISNGDGVAV